MLRRKPIRYRLLYTRLLLLHICIQTTGSTPCLSATHHHLDSSPSSPIHHIISARTPLCPPSPRSTSHCLPGISMDTPNE
ncbi:hypothetical protein BO70DRAFT_56004 [Aspergillus heteromorphus CBS 117.55]|uniref:Secreted protein n=1 Tax=Aspergillus heteromorphus CBS 117.55 TaxID=1448321 RepID=A0A317VY09_9EURO|nr:uncharacterized protein BO70DRAFT_56004 [Aspergillus heteromorphus CBS 117.55]PWY79173.1 hypothetical protein BO70DRAFT_56004 [Aspergillus heteromorphus CBS 117.55]